MKYLKQFTQFLSEMIFFRQLFFLNNWEWGSGWTPIEIIISLLFLIKFPMEGKKAPNVMQVPFFLKQYLTPTPVARGRDGLLEERCFGSLCISDQQFHGWQKNGARSGFPDRPMAHYNFSIGNSSTRRGDFPLPCRIWKIVTASRCLPKEKIKKAAPSCAITLTAPRLQTNDSLKCWFHRGTYPGHIHQTRCRSRFGNYPLPEALSYDSSAKAGDTATVLGIIWLLIAPRITLACAAPSRFGQIWPQDDSGGLPVASAISSGQVCPVQENRGSPRGGPKTAQHRLKGAAGQ